MLMPTFKSGIHLTPPSKKPGYGPVLYSEYEHIFGVGIIQYLFKSNKHSAHTYTHTHDHQSLAHVFGSSFDWVWLNSLNHFINMVRVN